MSEWYADWQKKDHVDHFDFRAELSDENLRRNYESYNDIRLLHERLPADRETTLVEVGCATGEMYRYLRRRFPRVRYCGIDISAPAIATARARYTDATFLQVAPGAPLKPALEAAKFAAPDILFSKDVVHHQERPLEFLSELLALPRETFIFRCRTRDQGPTEWNPELSCQFHYGGWMPYIVMNLDDVVGAIRKQAPAAEIKVVRHHMVLGGRLGRFVPKACFLKETGTSETAISVWLTGGQAGRVSISDRVDMNPQYTAGHTMRLVLRRIARYRQGKGA